MEAIREFEAKRDARPLVVGRATAYAAKKDGIRRYKANGNDYAIKKEGDTYTLYDYTDKIASKDLTLAELRRSLSEYDTKHNNAQETTKDTENATKEKTAPEKEAAKPKREKTPVEKSYEIAKSKVAKYDKLSANDQSMIRKIIRQGIALGVREDVIVYAANIAARTHTDVVFNKDMCAVPTKDGKHIRGYANGAYIASEKRFYFNPEAQTTDGFIIHELDHAIRKRVGTDGGVTTKIFKKAIDAAGKDTYTEITNRYGTKTDVPKGKFIPGKTETTEQKISKTEDEVEAFYAETALKDKDILKHLLAEKPTLKDRILNFFKGAVSDYASIPELDADAKKYYKQYRKWFAEFEKDQRGTQINTRFEGDGGDVSYSLPYETAIASLKDGTLDTVKNTHLKVLEHTPQIYIEKADAADREIVMGWDIAYLAMNKSGTIPGHYHGLGADVMKALPSALEDPLYIVKQNSGRIAAVTKIVVKGKRAVFASIELETFKTTIQDGEPESKVYNLVVTVTDAKPNYLQNTIFSGDIVYNKNSEDPAHFILRLKSLEKAVPTYDLAGSSKDSIPETAGKSNPSDENSSKKSSNFDVEYLAAVESGDMEAAQRMVDEAAKATMPKSQIKMPDGSLRKVYHGTNSGEFTVFNPGYIGMSSGDRGFFGKGFYFAYSKGEAKYYGAKRIISAYLNITNPFDFQRELQTFNGKRAGSGHAPDAVAFLNFAEKFPEIAAKSFVSVYNGEKGKDISLIEFAKAYRDVIENKRFEYQTVENEYGEKETLVLADKTVHSYDDNGVTRNYVDYGFQKRFWGDANELDVAYEYLSTVVYDYIDMYSRTRLVLDNNEEFTAKLREMGYDGAIQSVDGDEAIAFLPEQIKSADPVTYDDSGNAIPLSKRFDPQNPDIRYSLPLTDAKGNPIEYENVDIYTEKQYNNFGWARHSEALTKNELDDLYSKLQEKKILRRFKQSAQGEAIVEVNDKPHTTLGVDNVFVFVKGKATEPEITRVLRVSLFSETDMEKVRKYIYAREKVCPNGGESVIIRNIFDSGLFAEYRREDFGSYQEYRSEIRKRSLRSQSEGDPLADRIGLERGGDSRGSKDDVSFSLPLTDDKGNPIEYEDVINKGVPYAKMPEINETVGKMRQHIANAEHYKVFSKRRILKDIRQMSVGDLLKEDTRKKIAEEAT